MLSCDGCAGMLRLVCGGRYWLRRCRNTTTILPRHSFLGLRGESTARNVVDSGRSLLQVAPFERSHSFLQSL